MENKELKLSDIILDNLENIHIDAVGKEIGKTEDIRVAINFSKLKNPEINLEYWEERNTITGKLETKKKVSITFNDYDLNFSLKDPDEINILSCLWKASKKN